MKQTVLLVHPDQDRLERLVDILEDLGLRCVTARSGGEALATAASYPPHVAVVPAELVDVQGNDVCLRLKQEATTMGTRVIILAKDAGAEEEFLSNEVGADDYLVEPVSDEELVARIQAQRKPIYKSRPLVVRRKR